MENLYTKILMEFYCPIYDIEQKLLLNEQLLKNTFFAKQILPNNNSNILKSKQIYVI